MKIAKFWIYVAVFACTLLFFGLARVETVHADSSTGWLSNTGDDHQNGTVGKRHCNMLTSDCGILDAGLDNDIYNGHADSKQLFIDKIEGKLSPDTNTTQNKVSAAFIVLYTLGVAQSYTNASGAYDANIAILAARSRLPEWESKIKNPQVGIMLANASYTTNTAFTESINDVVIYGQSVNASSVIVYNKALDPTGALTCSPANNVGGYCNQYDNVYFAVKGDCGNIVGTPVPLPPPPPPNQPPVGSFTVSCDGVRGVAYDPDDRSVGVIFQGYLNGVFTGQSTSNGNTSTPPNSFSGGSLRYNPLTYKDKPSTVEIKIIDNQDPSVVVSLGTHTFGPCDIAPVAHVTISCDQAVGITMTDIHDDDDPSEGALRVAVNEISRSKPPGKRVVNAYSTNHMLNIPWVRSPVPGNDITHGWEGTAGLQTAEPGDYPDWSSIVLFIGIVSIDDKGNGVNNPNSGYAFDLNPGQSDYVDTDNITHYQKPGPCAQISCVSPAVDGVKFGSQLIAGLPNTATVAVQVDNALKPAPAGAAAFSVKINGATSSPVYDGGASSSTRLYSVSTPFTPTLGTLNISWGWSWPGGHYASNSATPYNCTPDIPPPVNAAPFFNVIGGDVAAGVPFYDSDGSCHQGTTVLNMLKASAIKSWNVDNQTGGNNYTGAGTDYAALATGPIRSFITNSNQVGNLNNNGGSFKPTDLAIANDHTPITYAPVDIANGKYGGGVGKLGCMTDQFDTLWAKAKPADISAASADDITDATQTKYYGGDLTLNGGPTSGMVSAGHGLTIVVKGSVFINSAINYSYGSLDQVPNVTIVAKNGIYISKDVHVLHGNFYAMGSSNGVFATCAVPNGSSFKETTDDCNSKLDVYGSVSAKTVHFDRTFGNIGSANGPAESFHYTPEAWLTQTAGPVCSNDCPYNNIAGLPPVL